MIKTITERSLYEVIQKMRAEGVTLKDTEGFGINVDQSGHIYVVYMGEESETGVIDTSAGEAGVSSWINPDSNSTAHAGYIEVGVIETDGSQTLTNSSGNTWGVTLTNATTPIESYIKPNTFSIAAVDTAPKIIDDGLGKLVTDDHNRHNVGTINYDTGVVAITYYANKAPLSSSTVTASYKYSALPNTAVFPKVVALSHIVFETSEEATVKFALYNNDPDRLGVAGNLVPSFFGTTDASVDYGSSGPYYAEFFCDSRISINLNTLVSDRKVRWMKIHTVSDGYVKAVHVYWNRLST